MESENLKEITKLFEIGAHLGHRKSRLHPKAKKYVYQMVNSTSVIDLSITVKQLENAKNYLSSQAKQGKSILVVATKKTAGATIKKYCIENKMPFITSKWLPGLITNFEELKKNVTKLKEMKLQQSQGEWDKMVKHEKVKLTKEMAKLERLFGGLVELSKRPDIVVVVDSKKEKNAVKEAREYNIPLVGLIDTNSNPDEITFPILANDDVSTVVEYIMFDLLSAYHKNKVEKKIETKVDKKLVN